MVKGNKQSQQMSVIGLTKCPLHCDACNEQMKNKPAAIEQKSRLFIIHSNFFNLPIKTYLTDYAWDVLKLQPR